MGISTMWRLRSKEIPDGLQFYVDGKVISTFDSTAVPGDLSNTSPLRIGNHPDPGISAFYHGIIDEVSLYNRALSSNEVAAIYNAGSAGKCLITNHPPVAARAPLFPWQYPEMVPMRGCPRWLAFL